MFEQVVFRFGGEDAGLEAAAKSAERRLKALRKQAADLQKALNEARPSRGSVRLDGADQASAQARTAQQSIDALNESISGLGDGLGSSVSEITNNIASVEAQAVSAISALSRIDDVAVGQATPSSQFTPEATEVISPDDIEDAITDGFEGVALDEISGAFSNAIKAGFESASGGLFGVLLAPIRAFSALAGTLLNGALFSISQNVSNDFSQQISGGLEKALSGTFLGSTSQIGAFVSASIAKGIETTTAIIPQQFKDIFAVVEQQANGVQLGILEGKLDSFLSRLSQFRDDAAARFVETIGGAEAAAQFNLRQQAQRAEQEAQDRQVAAQQAARNFQQRSEEARAFQRTTLVDTSGLTARRNDLKEQRAELDRLILELEQEAAVIDLASEDGINRADELRVSISQLKDAQADTNQKFQDVGELLRTLRNGESDETTLDRVIEAVNVRRRLVISADAQIESAQQRLEEIDQDELITPEIQDERSQLKQSIDNLDNERKQSTRQIGTLLTIAAKSTVNDQAGARFKELTDIVQSEQRELARLQSILEARQNNIDDDDFATGAERDNEALAQIGELQREIARLQPLIIEDEISDQNFRNIDALEQAQSDLQALVAQRPENQIEELNSLIETYQSSIINSNAEIEKIQQAAINRTAQYRQLRDEQVAADRQLNSLSIPEQPRAVRDIANEIATLRGESFDDEQLPQIVIDETFLNGRGANSTYEAALNQISVTREMFEAIQNGTLNREQALILGEEISTAFATNFGDLDPDGIDAREVDQDRLTELRQLFKEDAVRIQQELVNYDDNRKELEELTKLEGVAAAAKILRDQEGRNNQSVVQKIAETAKGVEDGIAEDIRALDTLSSASNRLSPEAKSSIEQQRRVLESLREQSQEILSAASQGLADGELDSDGLKDAIDIIRKSEIQIKDQITTRQATIAELGRNRLAGVQVNLDGVRNVLGENLVNNIQDALDIESTLSNAYVELANSPAGQATKEAKDAVEQEIEKVRTFLRDVNSAIDNAGKDADGNVQNELIAGLVANSKQFAGEAKTVITTVAKNATDTAKSALADTAKATGQLLKDATISAANATGQAALNVADAATAPARQAVSDKVQELTDAVESAKDNGIEKLSKLIGEELANDVAGLLDIKKGFENSLEVINSQATSEASQKAKAAVEERLKEVGDAITETTRSLGDFIASSDENKTEDIKTRIRSKFDGFRDAIEATEDAISEFRNQSLGERIRTVASGAGIVARDAASGASNAAAAAVGNVVDAVGSNAAVEGTKGFLRGIRSVVSVLGDVTSKGLEAASVLEKIVFALDPLGAPDAAKKVIQKLAPTVAGAAGIAAASQVIPGGTDLVPNLFNAISHAVEPIVNGGINSLLDGIRQIFAASPGILGGAPRVTGAENATLDALRTVLEFIAPSIKNIAATGLTGAAAFGASAGTARAVANTGRAAVSSVTNRTNDFIDSPTETEVDESLENSAKEIDEYKKQVVKLAKETATKTRQLSRGIEKIADNIEDSIDSGIDILAKARFGDFDRIIGDGIANINKEIAELETNNIDGVVSSEIKELKKRRDKLVETQRDITSRISEIDGGIPDTLNTGPVDNKVGDKFKSLVSSANSLIADFSEIDQQASVVKTLRDAITSERIVNIVSDGIVDPVNTVANVAVDTVQKYESLQSALRDLAINAVATGASVAANQATGGTGLNPASLGADFSAALVARLGSSAADAFNDALKTVRGTEEFEAASKLERVGIVLREAAQQLNTSADALGNELFGDITGFIAGNAGAVATRATSAAAGSIPAVGGAVSAAIDAQPAPGAIIASVVVPQLQKLREQFTNDNSLELATTGAVDNLRGDVANFVSDAFKNFSSGIAENLEFIENVLNDADGDNQNIAAEQAQRVANAANRVIRAEDALADAGGEDAQAQSELDAALADFEVQQNRFNEIAEDIAKQSTEALKKRSDRLASDLVDLDNRLSDGDESVREEYDKAVESYEQVEEELAGRGLSIKRAADFLRSRVEDAVRPTEQAPEIGPVRALDAPAEGIVDVDQLFGGLQEVINRFNGSLEKAYRDRFESFNADIDEALKSLDLRLEASLSSGDIDQQQNIQAARNNLLEQRAATGGILEGDVISPRQIEQLDNAERQIRAVYAAMGRDVPNNLGPEIAKQASIGVRALQGLGVALGGVFTANTFFDLSRQFGDVLQDILKDYAEFQEQLQLFGVVSGSLGTDEFDLANAQIRELGATTTKTAADAAEAAVELSKIGFSAVEVATSLETVIKVSEATTESIGRSTEVIGATINQFGLLSKNQEQLALNNQRVGDVLVSIANNSATDINSAGQTFKFLATQARLANQSLEETGALVALVANAGVKGSSAGTGLAEALRRLQLAAASSSSELTTLEQKSADGAVQALNDLQIEATNAEGRLRPLTDLIPEIAESLSRRSPGDQGYLLNQLFGVRGGRAFGAIVNQSREEIQETLNLLLNAGGTAGDSAGQVTQGFAGNLKLLQSAIEDIRTSIGAVLADALNPLLQAAANVLNTIGRVPDPVLKGAAAFAAFGVSLAGITAAIAAYRLAQELGITSILKATAITTRDTLAKLSSVTANNSLTNSNVLLRIASTNLGDALNDLTSDKSADTQATNANAAAIDRQTAAQIRANAAARNSQVQTNPLTQADQRRNIGLGRGVQGPLPSPSAGRQSSFAQFSKAADAISDVADAAEASSVRTLSATQKLGNGFKNTGAGIRSFASNSASSITKAFGGIAAAAGPAAAGIGSVLLSAAPLALAFAAVRAGFAGFNELLALLPIVGDRFGETGAAAREMSEGIKEADKTLEQVRDRLKKIQDGEELDDFAGDLERARKAAGENLNGVVGLLDKLQQTIAGFVDAEDNPVIEFLDKLGERIPLADRLADLAEDVVNFEPIRNFRENNTIRAASQNRSEIQGNELIQETQGDIDELLSSVDIDLTTTGRNELPELFSNLDPKELTELEKGIGAIQEQVNKPDLELFTEGTAQNIQASRNEVGKLLAAVRDAQQENDSALPEVTGERIESLVAIVDEETKKLQQAEIQLLTSAQERFNSGEINEDQLGAEQLSIRQDTIEKQLKLEEQAKADFEELDRQDRDLLNNEGVFSEGAAEAIAEASKEFDERINETRSNLADSQGESIRQSADSQLAALNDGIEDQINAVEAGSQEQLLAIAQREAAGTLTQEQAAAQQLANKQNEINEFIRLEQERIALLEGQSFTGEAEEQRIQDIEESEAKVTQLQIDAAKQVTEAKKAELDQQVEDRIQAEQQAVDAAESAEREALLEIARLLDQGVINEEEAERRKTQATIEGVNARIAAEEARLAALQNQGVQSDPALEQARQDSIAESQTNLTSLYGQRVDTQNQLEQDAVNELKEAQDKALAELESAEQERTLLLKERELQLRKSGENTQEIERQLAEESLSSEREKLEKRLELNNDFIADLEQQQAETGVDNQDAIDESRRESSQIAIDLVDNEIAAQDLLTQRVLDNISKEEKRRKTASDAAIASIQRQQTLFDSRVSVAESLANLEQTRANNAASLATDELTRAQLEEETARRQLDVLAQRQEAERVSLALAQRRARLEAKIAVDQARAELAKAEAEGATPEEIDARQSVLNIQSQIASDIVEIQENERAALQNNQLAEQDSAQTALIQSNRNLADVTAKRAREDDARRRADQARRGINTTRPNTVGGRSAAEKRADDERLRLERRDAEARQRANQGTFSAVDEYSEAISNAARGIDELGVESRQNDQEGLSSTFDGAIDREENQELTSNSQIVQSIEDGTFDSEFTESQAIENIAVNVNAIRKIAESQDGQSAQSVDATNAQETPQISETLPSIADTDRLAKNVFAIEGIAAFKPIDFQQSFDEIIDRELAINTESVDSAISRQISVIDGGFIGGTSLRSNLGIGEGLDRDSLDIERNNLESLVGSGKLEGAEFANANNRLTEVIGLLNKTITEEQRQEIQTEISDREEVISRLEGGGNGQDVRNLRDLFLERAGIERGSDEDRALKFVQDEELLLEQGERFDRIADAQDLASKRSLEAAEKIQGADISESLTGVGDDLTGSIESDFSSLSSALQDVIQDINSLEPPQFKKFFRGGLSSAGQTISVSEKGGEIVKGLRSGSETYIPSQSFITPDEPVRIYNAAQTKKRLQDQLNATSFVDSNGASVDAYEWAKQSTPNFAVGGLVTQAYQHLNALNSAHEQQQSFAQANAMHEATIKEMRGLRDEMHKVFKATDATARETLNVVSGIENIPQVLNNASSKDKAVMKEIMRRSRGY